MKDMQSFILGIVVVSVTLVIGIYIVSQIQTTMLVGGVAGGATTVSSNAAGSAVTALSNGTPWLTILVVVGFAVIVLGMLTSGFSDASGGSPVY